MKNSFLRALTSAGITGYPLLDEFRWDELSQPLVAEVIFGELRRKKISFDSICALSDSSKIVSGMSTQLKVPFYLKVEYVPGIPGGFHLQCVSTKTGKTVKSSMDLKNKRALLVGCNFQNCVEFDYAESLLRSRGLECFDALALVGRQNEEAPIQRGGYRVHALTTVKEIENFSKPVFTGAWPDFSQHHDVIK